MNEILPYDPSDFVCFHCEQSHPQSPTWEWEEYCVWCCIEFLESDIELNREKARNAG